MPAARYRLVLLLLGVFALYGWLGWRGDFVGNLSDSLVYLAMADFLSPWYTAHPGPGLDLFRDFAFPPLFPLVLGLAGGGSAGPEQSYLLHALLMTASIGTVFLFARRVGVPKRTAGVLTLFIAVLPASMLNAMNLLSEALFMTLSYGALACAQGWPRRTVLAALLIGLSALARSAGIALIGAALIHFAWHRPEAPRLRCLLALLLPAGLWAVLRQLLGTESSYLTDVLIGDLARTLSWLTHVVASNLAATPGAFVEIFGLQRSLPAAAAALLVVTPALAVWLSRLRRGEIDALWVILYLGMVLLWPHAAHLPRFLFVLVPLIAVYAVIGIQHSARLAGASSAIGERGSLFILALLVICIAPASGRITAAVADESHAPLNRSPQWHRYESPAKAAAAMHLLPEIIESLAGVDERVPANACVTTVAPPYVALYGRRRAVPVVDAATAEEVLLRQLERCPYVFMMAASQWPAGDLPPMYPYRRLEKVLQVIEVKLQDRARNRGSVLTMLARYQAAPPGGAVAAP